MSITWDDGMSLHGRSWRVPGAQRVHATEDERKGKMANPTEEYVVARALADYAHKKLADHLTYDYDRQLKKWQTHFNKMVAAQVEAVKDHTNVLKEAREDIEQRRQAAAGLAMLAFSIVGGP